MKILIGLVFLVAPFWLFAQNYPEMDQQQIEAMMEDAQKMEDCMQNIDQEEMRALEQQAKQMESEVQALCAAGKRDQAQRKAMTFAKEVAKNPAVQEMKKCGEMMKDFIPGMPGMTETDEGDKSEQHICDY